ncbi:MAG: hypothetical protein RR086_02550 [Clostridia bacterium]
MKIWARTIVGEKITKDYIYKDAHINDIDTFIFIAQQICEKLDIPTPLITKTDYNYLTEFNSTRFTARDL